LLIGIDGMTFLLVLIQSIWFNDNHHHHILICLLIIYTKASKRVYMYTYWKSRVLPSMHTKQKREREREYYSSTITIYMYVHILTFSIYCIVSPFHAYYNNRLWLMREREETLSCSKFFFTTHSLAGKFKHKVMTIKRQKMTRSFSFFLTNRRQTNISIKIVLCLVLNDAHFR
jgi:hypothetical protein